MEKSLGEKTEQTNTKEGGIQKDHQCQDLVEPNMASSELLLG